MVVPVLVAFGSAACFAVGSALQHRAASAVTHEDEPHHRLIWRLLRRRSWLVGILLSLVAFGLHGLALSRGGLALVQPIIVSGIVFAVLIRAGLDRHRPDRQVIFWLLLTCVGLTLFISVRTDVPGSGFRRPAAYLLIAVVVAFSAALLLIAHRVRSPRIRGLLLGTAAGVLYGLVAGLLKLVTIQLGHGGLRAALSGGAMWALIVVGVVAILINQRAYQVTLLSITAPLLNIAEVMVAITFGLLVFGERFGESPLIFTAEVGGLLMMGIGIWRLAAHPLD